MFNKYRQEYEKEYNKELKKTGIFWAFDNKQFEENKTHKDAPDNEYLFIKSGGYIHKSNKFKLDYFLNVTLPKLKREYISKIKMEDLIAYELENHECYYTGNIRDAVEAVYDYYELPKNEIINKVLEVYNKKTSKVMGHNQDAMNVTKSIYGIKEEKADKEDINIGELQQTIKIKNKGLRKSLEILEQLKYLVYQEYGTGMYTINLLGC